VADNPVQTSVRRLPKLKAGLDWIASLSMVALAGLLLTGQMKVGFSSESSRRGAAAAELAGLPSDPVALDGIRIGDRAAKAVVIVFSDFECPFCRQFATGTWPRLLTDYVRPGLVQVVFRNLPLESIHPRARELATAAVCADRQGAFEVVHDRLFLERPADSDWSSLANVSAINRATFSQCMESTGNAVVNRDIEFAKGLSVSATPTLMFGTLAPDDKARIVLRRDGAMSMDEIKSVLARALSVED